MITIGDAILFLRGDQTGLDRDLASAANKTQGWAGKLGGSLSGLLGGAIVGGIAALIGAVVGIGGAALASAVQLDDAFDNIQVKTGATGDELATLQGDFKKVFTSIPVDSAVASDAIATLNSRLGITGDALTDIATPLAEASRLMGGDAKLNAELLTRAMGDWGIGVEDGAATLDKFFTASQQSGIGLDVLMDKVVQFGAPLRLMGFSLDESIALFAKWEKEGVNAELVMGSLRIAAGKFADAGKPLKESLMETFDAIKNGEDPTKALALAMEVFGARAGPDMAAAIREGRFEIDDLVNALGESEGAIMDASAATMDYAERWKIAKNKITVALQPLGAVIMEALGKIVDKVAPHLEKLGLIIEAFGKYIGFVVEEGDYLNDWLTHLPKPLQGVVKAIGRIVAAVGELAKGDLKEALTTLFGPETAVTILETLGKINKFISGTLMPVLKSVIDWILANRETILKVIAGIATGLAAFSIISTVVGWITGLIAAVTAVSGAIGTAGGVISAIVAILGGPLTIAIGAVAALIGLFTAAWLNNWGDIQGKTRAVLDWIGSKLQEALAAWQGFWSAHGEQITAVAQQAWSFIQSIVDGVLKVIGALFDAFAAAFEGDWYAFGENLRLAWDTAWQLINGVLDAAKETLKTTLTTAIDALKSLWNNTDWGKLGTNLTEAIKKAITNGAGAIKTALLNAAKAAWDAVMGFFGGKKGNSGQSTNPDHGNDRASGGPVEAWTPYNWQEYAPTRPEVLVSSLDGYVLTKQDAQQALAMAATAGMGTGQQVNITVPLTVIGGEPEKVMKAAESGVLSAARAVGLA